MIKEAELKIYPDNINDIRFITIQAAKKLKLNHERIKSIRIVKKSIDARSRFPFFTLRLQVIVDKPETEKTITFESLVKPDSKKVIVVGSGPAGLFGALRLMELGISPVVFDRGKDVQGRRRDIRNLHIQGDVNPESNYCFGEGGAGTFSDGKLYTRSNKRGDISRALEILVYHGAEPEILYEAHPHIGSNKLPGVIKNIRNTINTKGGEVHYDSRVTDFIVENNKIKGVIINGEKEVTADAVLLATGHSSRDIYYLLQKHNVPLQFKPFALGVRIEHPQQLIDSAQYHSESRHPNLPAASYSLVSQIQGKGVFSFCMCPGGILVPASTLPDELVLNGMSVSRRDSPYANSGLVVTVDYNDITEFHQFGEFAGIEFQKEVEHKAFAAGGNNQLAPAQRVNDFVSGRVSVDLPKTSYRPGTFSCNLDEILPAFISDRLKQAINEFDKKIKGFNTNEAQVLAPESRTSSPLRILRNQETFMSVLTEGLFPAGEGAGYAGGIISSAMDGQNTAEAISKYLN